MIVLLVERVFAALVRRWSVAVVRRCRRSLETHQRRALLAVDEVLQRRRAVHLNPRQSGPLTHRHTYPRVVKRYPPVESSETKVSASETISYASCRVNRDFCLHWWRFNGKGNVELYSA